MRNWVLDYLASHKTYKVADYFANLVFFFIGIEFLIYQFIEHVSTQEKALMGLDAQ